MEWPKPTTFDVKGNNSISNNISYITVDATNITIFYAKAPANGTNNLSYTWWANK